MAKRKKPAEPKTEARNAYAILQVAESATEEIVELVYKRLAFNEHPDRSTDKKKAEERLKEINWAHETLSDPKKRKVHDLELQARKPESAPVVREPIYVYVPVQMMSMRQPPPHAFGGCSVEIHEDSEHMIDERCTLTIHDPV